MKTDPPRVDTEKCQERKAELYEDINTYHLIPEGNHVEPSVPMNSQLLNAVETATTEYKDQFDEKAVAEYHKRSEETTALRGLGNAHTSLGSMCSATVRVRERDLTNRANGLIASLKTKVEDGSKTGHVNPRALAAWEIVKTAQQKIDDRQDQQRNRVDTAVEAAKRELAKAQAETRRFQERVVYLEGELERLKVELQSRSLVFAKSAETEEDDRRAPR